MVNEAGALVGSGPMEPRGNEKAPVGADVDVFVHPVFHGAAEMLVAAMAEEARTRGWRWLRAELGERDAAKRELLSRAGFREVGRVPGAIVIDGAPEDARVVRLDL